MKKSVKKVLALLLTLCTVFSLAACGEGQGGEQPAAKKYINYSVTSQQNHCNPLTATATVDCDFADYLTSGLYGTIADPATKKGVRVPMYAAAEPVDVSGDGTVWQIAISPNAKWQNGEAITADTFLYSWKMCLDPTLLCSGAGNLSNKYVTILNAEAYYMQAATGETVAWEDVGLKKVDDLTVEITLAEPYTKTEMMMHFAQRSAYPVYEPLFEAGMNSDRSETTYGTELSQMMSCGKFYVSQWTKGSEVRYEKNPDWPYADLIKLDGMVARVVQDNNTQLQMFEAGELDYVTVGADGIERYEEDPRLKIGASNYIDTIDICKTNTEKPILGNDNFQQALFHAIDRVTIAKLTKYNPAEGLISHQGVSYADGTAFRDLDFVKEYALGENNNYGYDPELAKQLFDKAMEEEGLDFVELSLLYNSEAQKTKVQAEFLQEALMTVFGADKCKIELDGMPSALALEKKRECKTNSEAYEIAISSWSIAGSKDNPIFSLQVYTSDYARRLAPYNNTKADELFKQSKTYEVRMDEVKLAQVTAAMEKTLLENADAIPIVERTSFVMFSDRLVPYLEKQDPTLGWGFIYSDLKVD